MDYAVKIHRHGHELGIKHMEKFNYHDPLVYLIYHTHCKRKMELTQLGLLDPQREPLEIDEETLALYLHEDWLKPVTFQQGVYLSAWNPDQRVGLLVANRPYFGHVFYLWNVQLCLHNKKIHDAQTQLWCPQIYQKDLEQLGQTFGYRIATPFEDEPILAMNVATPDYTWQAILQDWQDERQIPQHSAYNPTNNAFTTGICHGCEGHDFCFC